MRGKLINKANKVAMISENVMSNPGLRYPSNHSDFYW